MRLVSKRSLWMRIVIGAIFLALGYLLLLQGIDWWPLLLMFSGSVLVFTTIDDFDDRARNPEYCQLFDELYVLLRSKPKGIRQSEDGTAVLWVHKGKALVRQRRSDETEDSYLRVTDKFGVFLGRINRGHYVTQVTKKNGKDAGTRQLYPQTTSLREALSHPRQLLRQVDVELELGNGSANERELRAIMDEWQNASPRVSS